MHPISLSLLFHQQIYHLKSTTLVLQNERRIRTAHQPRRSGDHVKGITGRLLAGVVDQEDRNVKPVGDAFQDRHGSVVSGVTVIFGFHVPDLLERIDQNKVHCRTLSQEIDELFLKSVSDHLRFRDDPDLSGVPVRHVHQSALYAGERIFETEVQHLARVTGKVPDRLTGGDAVCHPEGKPGLSGFGRTGENVQAGGDQFVHQEDRLGEFHVHDFIGGEHVELCVLDPEHSAQMADRLLRCVEAVVDHHIVHHVAAEITGFTVPQDLSLNAAAAVALGTDGEGGRPVSHMVRFQIVDEMTSELGTQVLIRLIHCVLLVVQDCFAVNGSPFSLRTAGPSLWLCGE